MTRPIDIDLFKQDQAALDAYLQSWVGEKLNTHGTNTAPDPVNMPMIRHWIDAFDDRNPVYEDKAVAEKTRFKGLIAPPAMMQTWAMPRPIIKGIGERGGAAQALDPDTPLGVLDRVGFVGILATNSELEFDRPLRVGDELHSDVILDAVSPRKKTGLGQGYFVTWVQEYLDQHSKPVGRQKFSVLKFDPSTIGQ
ncbi:MAG TPA: MaoC family dehydratase N-terminal domain-containing protein [Pseudomonadales bacterium]|jgi:acyl dehydratase